MQAAEGRPLLGNADAESLQSGRHMGRQQGAPAASASVASAIQNRDIAGTSHKLQGLVAPVPVLNPNCEINTVTDC